MIMFSNSDCTAAVLAGVQVNHQRHSTQVAWKKIWHRARKLCRRNQGDGRWWLVASASVSRPRWRSISSRVLPGAPFGDRAVHCSAPECSTRRPAGARGLVHALGGQLLTIAAGCWRCRRCRRQQSASPGRYRRRGSVGFLSTVKRDDIESGDWRGCWRLKAAPSAPAPAARSWLEYAMPGRAQITTQQRRAAAIMTAMAGLP